MNFGREVSVNNAGEFYTAPPWLISQVLPFRGNVPPITQPEFVSPSEADKYLKETDSVIGLNFKGIQKAYPVKILRWHIMLSDDIASEPFIIAYDPLSDMGVAYKRTILEKALTLKASDKVYNANPVLEDKETKSLWSLFTGEAIMGRLAAQTLEEVPVSVVAWSDWKNAHPDTEVLSINTGFNRDYEKNVYEKYYSHNLVLFDVQNKDERLKNKVKVFGIALDGAAKAYLPADLKRGTRISDTIGKVKININVDNNNIISALRADNGERVAVRNMFWYTWAAFNANTDIYGR
ncbi:MAG: DUF3179 domain-containing (seleno)protein [bacterium]|nr:DUF3179 domain-containing (seleno)protein [bacterium]